MSRRFVTETAALLFPRVPPPIRRRARFSASGATISGTVRSLLACALLAALLALAAVAAAAAISQPRLGSSARSVTGTQDPILFYVTASQAKSSHTCQKTSKNRQSVRRGKLIPIACEQPPRMNLATGSTLTKAAAVDAIG
jgi:hypothetical protein